MGCVLDFWESDFWFENRESIFYRRGCLLSECKEWLIRVTGGKSDKDLLFQVSASQKVSFDMRKPFYAFCNSKNLKSQINVKGHIFISIPAPDDTDCCS